MKCYNNKTRNYRGMSLVEIIISLSIMVIIFAAIVPLFRNINNSWDSKAAIAEVLQNGRVLVDHLNLNLAKAVEITAVSNPSETKGYIEFRDNSGASLRYDIAASNYVEFGKVGALSELAGPVSQLQFTCYDVCDLDMPISDLHDVNSTCLVKVETTLTNSAARLPDKSFMTKVFLFAKGNPDFKEEPTDFNPGVALKANMNYVGASGIFDTYNSNLGSYG
ncbi:MAG TPA: prepilin-type N-terminal cleavage/methylation domain-containing protein, partial [Sedimentisphaerales bacterium]|nr:prepilin-type N-terminal cleavage/methylation domain-containing protein [Sedimentisphaerales bacterium]